MSYKAYYKDFITFLVIPVCTQMRIKCDVIKCEVSMINNNTSNKMKAVSDDVTTDIWDLKNDVMRYISG